MRHSIEYCCSHGILTVCPSTTPFGLALGSTNPGMIAIAQETLDFRGVRISLTLRLLMPTFSLLYAPPWLTPLTSSHKERSPTNPCATRKHQITNHNFQTKFNIQNNKSQTNTCFEI